MIELTPKFLSYSASDWIPHTVSMLDNIKGHGLEAFVCWPVSDGALSEVVGDHSHSVKGYLDYYVYHALCLTVPI